jgi:hypothetical protein
MRREGAGSGPQAPKPVSWGSSSRLRKWRGNGLPRPDPPREKPLRWPCRLRRPRPRPSTALPVIGVQSHRHVGGGAPERHRAVAGSPGPGDDGEHRHGPDALRRLGTPYLGAEGRAEQRRVQVAGDRPRGRCRSRRCGSDPQQAGDARWRPAPAHLNDATSVAASYPAGWGSPATRRARARAAARGRRGRVRQRRRGGRGCAALPPARRLSRTRGTGEGDPVLGVDDGRAPARPRSYR